MNFHEILFYIMLVAVTICGALWNVKFDKMKREYSELEKQNKELAIELSKTYKELYEIKQKNADAE